MTKARRYSHQRHVILEEIRRTKVHPTAAELHELVRARLPKISLGTVYRNLELLVREGDIRKLTVAGGRARYDAHTPNHLHVRCVSCGNIDDAPTDWASFADREVETPGGYEILGLSMEFIGICPSCGRTLSPEEIERLRREWGQ
jgi:Fur family ferric uptake transcriptional regulator